MRHMSEQLPNQQSTPEHGPVQQKTAEYLAARKPILMLASYIVLRHPQAQLGNQGAINGQLTHARPDARFVYDTDSQGLAYGISLYDQPTDYDDAGDVAELNISLGSVPPEPTNEIEYVLLGSPNLEDHAIIEGPTAHDEPQHRALTQDDLRMVHDRLTAIYADLPAG